MNKNTLLFPSHLHFISSLMFLELYLHWFFKRKGYFINWNVQQEYPLHPNLSKAKIKAKIRRYNKKWTSKDSAWWYPLLSFDQVVLATLFAFWTFTPTYNVGKQRKNLLSIIIAGVSLLDCDSFEIWQKLIFEKYFFYLWVLSEIIGQPKIQFSIGCKIKINDISTTFLQQILSVRLLLIVIVGAKK